MQNKAVREAIDLSLDRKRIANLLFGPQSQTCCLPYSSNSLAHFEEFDNCEYDLDKARTVLEGAGVELPLEVKF
ncbi:ABC transporter substrate-binding protein [Pararhizobium sp. IMCC21322]|uniref:ABC transporter substrate-binding protein n=1 Tax=Pararhizobium sp. IMCC21322 TaxID=3067903 RepID=UPI003531B2BD